MANVIALTLVVFYIYSILGFFWFGHVGVHNVTKVMSKDTLPGVNRSVDYWSARSISTGINDRANFHTLPCGLLTLVRILTGDQWGMLMGDCMRNAYGELSGVQMVFSVLFYSSFLFISTLCVNILVAVLLTQGIETYFDTGLLKSLSLIHI